MPVESPTPSTSRQNEWGQPIGDDLASWTPPPVPPHQTLEGASVCLSPFDLDAHPTPLLHAYDASPLSMWTYLPYGPFTSREELVEIVGRLKRRPDWQVYAVEVEKGDTTRAIGFLCYLRIDSRCGVIEIGGVTFSAALQRTRAASEAFFLLIDHAFSLGYRRVEWKCDALNGPSVRAAERLGFTYEGTFRKATHYKGRSRDTVWFAIIDTEWPSLRAEFTRWLDDDNFDEHGLQRSPLRHSAQRAVPR